MMYFPLILLTIAVMRGRSQEVVEDAAFWRRVGQNELRAALLTRHNTGVARNVVVFVGDGMDPNTITAARIYRGQQSGRGKEAESGLLAFERFPNLALLKTYCVDKMVPDSASTATALFTGVKTNFESSGVDATVASKDCEASLNDSARVDSIVDWAQRAGKLTGFITNNRVTHATPSALYAHTAYRKWECEASMPESARRCKDIGRQLVEDVPGRNLRVIMGGGRKSLSSNITIDPNELGDKWSCSRADGRELMHEWVAQKRELGAEHALVHTTGQLRAVDPHKTEYLMGIFSNDHMKYDYDRDTSEKGTPSLAEMTRVALKMLQHHQSEGFLLVVEGGMIDQAHHRGTARRALDETVKLEDAIQEAINLTNPENTLIIVTADHGHTMAINGYPPRGANILGLSMLSKVDKRPYTVLTYATGTEIKYHVGSSGGIERTDPTNEDTTDFLYKQHSAVSQDEQKHGGGEVTVYAKGPMAHLFQGVHEQNYVAHVVAYAAKMGPYGRSGSVPKTSLSFIVLTSALLLNRIIYA